METIFSFLTEAMHGSFFLAVLASFAWGIMSIILSPCHLSSIPLIIGYISSGGTITTKKSISYSLLFAIGILVTIAGIGIITASMGRLMGDLGQIGNGIVALVFFIVGFYLLGFISLPVNGFMIKNPRRGWLGALILGLIFGLGLGPCTFAYFAPVLGIVFGIASKSWISALIIIFAFAIGHCLVIVVAGSLTTLVNRYAKWFSKKNASGIIQKAAGVLVILGGIFFVITNL